MYRVKWEIDVDADTPEAAARRARAVQRKPDSAAMVFDVIDGHGRRVRVDLVRTDGTESLTCDNCGRQCLEHELEHRFPNIPDLAERVEPGGTVPSGECPACGALAYPDRPAAQLLVVLEGGLVEAIHSDTPGLRAAVLNLDCEGMEPEDLVEISDDSEPLQGTLDEHDVLESPALVAAAVRLLEAGNA